MQNNQSKLCLLVYVASGVLFGLGLSVSQMINPEKVLGFLDVAGNWDPTLAFVMGGALLVTIPGFHWVLKRNNPMFSRSFFLPTAKDIDRRLVTGAAIFGVGWGIAGLCPGPALTALTTGLLPVVGFVVAMAAGIFLHMKVLEK